MEKRCIFKDFRVENTLLFNESNICTSTSKHDLIHSPLSPRLADVCKKGGEKYVYFVIHRGVNNRHFRAVGIHTSKTLICTVDFGFMCL